MPIPALLSPKRSTNTSSNISSNGNGDSVSSTRMNSCGIWAHLHFGRHVSDVKGEDGCLRKGGRLDIGLRHRPQVCSDQCQLDLLLRDLGDNLSETIAAQGAG